MAQEIYHRSEWGNPNEQWGNIYLNADLTNELYKRASEYENSWVTDQLLNGVGIKPSIILTPTAYEDGVLNSVKPAKTFGSELVTNGDFSDGTNDWSFDNVGGTKGWRIADNRAICDVSGASNGRNLQQYLDISITSGKKYKVSLDILQSEDSILLFIGGQTVTLPSGTNVGYETTFVATSTSTLITFFASTSDTQEIDNISIKEVTDADFDFTRGSSATRVNEKGLIQDVQILSDELVQNGNFEQIGSELVTNGDFATDSDWTKGSGWTIADGLASYDASGTSAITSSSTSIVSSKIYRLKFKIITSGFARLNFTTDGSQSLFQPNGNSLNNFADGEHTFYLSAQNNSTALKIFAYNVSGGTSFSIDNVSVKEVGQNWTVANEDANNYVEFNQGEGTVRLKFLNTTPLTTLTSNTQYLSGKKYKLTVDVKEAVSGGIKIDAAGVSQTYNSAGIQEAIIEPTGSANISFYRATADVDITLNSVSLIEITDDTDLPRINYTNFDYKDVLGDELVTNGDFATDSDWTLGTGWSIEDGKAVRTSTASSGLTQSGSFNSGKKYKLEFTISDYVGGSIKGEFSGGGGSDVFFTSNNIGDGTFTFITETTTNRTNLQFYAFNSFNGSIDNVSVKELTEDVVVPYSGEGSLLLEPQSTNKVTYSEDFTQWTKSGGASVESGYLAPDGSNNAYKVSGTSSSSLYLASITNTTDTRTIWARTVSGTGDVYLCGNLNDVNALFTVTSQWQRFELNGFTGGGASTFYAVDFRGSSTLTEVIIWGAQTEELSFATSYIPTEGSIKTRLQDICNNAGSSDLINSTEGVLYAEVASLSNSNAFYIGVYGGSLSRVRILFTSNAIKGQLFNGSFQCDISSSQNISNNNKIAFKYKENDFALWINGIKVGTDSSGLTFTQNTLSYLSLSGYQGNILNCEGNVKCLAVFKEALSDTELQKLTQV